MSVSEQFNGFFIGNDKEWLKELPVLNEEQRSRIVSLLRRMMIFSFLLGLVGGINFILFVQSVIV